jgi:hypothetical protein
MAGMNYTQIREDALSRRQQLHERLSTILEERKRLQAEMEDKQRELAALDLILQSVDSLSSAEPIEGEPSGMADHVRRLLQQTPIHLLPTQIRDSLIVRGITGSSPKNLLIGVHNVIARLEHFLDKSEINNRPAYRWKRKANNVTTGTP